MPVSAYFGFTLMELAHIGYVCSTLLKLSLVEEEGWDLVHVRETVNVQFYFDQLSSKFIQAGNSIDRIQNQVCAESFPTGCSRAILKVKAWYEAKLAGEAVQDAGVPQDETNMMGMGATLSIDQMMLDDVDWFEFVMGDCGHWK